MFESTEDIFKRLRLFEGIPLKAFVGDSPLYKGTTGHLVEQILGIAPNSRSEPDLPELGIEIKTLPIMPNGSVKENTFLMSIEMPFLGGSLLKSSLYRKIQKIIFVPIMRAMSDRISPDDRIGKAFFHEFIGPSQEQLQADWDLLSSVIFEGELEWIDAELGEILHIRPKARNSQHLQKGVSGYINPMGWYLRKQYTQKIFDDAQRIRSMASSTI